MTIDAKLAFFAPYVQRMREQGGLMREAQGPAGAHMRYSTPRSGAPMLEPHRFRVDRYRHVCETRVALAPDFRDVRFLFRGRDFSHRQGSPAGTCVDRLQDQKPAPHRIAKGDSRLAAAAGGR